MTSPEIKCENKITTSTHIYVSIAAACFAWILLCVPATTLLKNKGYSAALICFTLFIYCIVFPSIVISNETYKSAIYGEEIFRLAKLLSVVIAVLITQSCLFYTYYYKKNETSSLLTACVYFVFIVNIIEACVTSFKNYYYNKPEIDGVTEIEGADLYLCIMGIIMAIGLFINYYKGGKIGVDSGGSKLKLICNFSWLFIIAYTIWNLAFKIQLIEHPLVLTFFVVSLLLPIFTHYFGIGDWVQIRALSLLFVIYMEIGLTKGQGSIFPNYNSEGNIPDKDDNITKFFSNKEFKTLLIGVGMIVTILFFIDIIKNDKSL